LQLANFCWFSQLDFCLQFNADCEVVDVATPVMVI